MNITRRGFFNATLASAAVALVPGRAAANQRPAVRLRLGGDDGGFDPWIEIIGDSVRHNAREV
jgi:hypothetical protein